MATLEEELTLFEATQPHCANAMDIERGRRLLDRISQHDTLLNVNLLARLASFYLENKKLDQQESLAQARVCFWKIVSLAQEHGNAGWLALGSSGGASCLVKQYELERNPEDLLNAERIFKELIQIYDSVGMSDDALSNRASYADMLMKAVHGDRYENFQKAIMLYRENLSASTQQARGEFFDPLQYRRDLYNLAAALYKQTEEPHARTLNINEAVDALHFSLLFPVPVGDPSGEIDVLRALAIMLPEWTGATSTAHAYQLAEEANEQADALASDVTPASDAMRDKAGRTLAEVVRSALFRDDLVTGLNHRIQLDQEIASHSTNINRISRDRFPLLWAEWVGGYAKLVGNIAIEDDSQELLEESSSALVEALKNVPKDKNPRLRLLLSRELGRVYHQSSSWEGSLAANGEAVNIGVALADASATNGSQDHELEDVTLAIDYATYAAEQLNKPDEAARFAEMGKYLVGFSCHDTYENS